ncbi:hypothetical protein P886_3741 [Alteromonadaceae bacterium 2753L.S.0a.02]|nr:hypothetical protein P886_3741 [Alteromonadaceae bacterium 2753L.S.0a.02]
MTTTHETPGNFPLEQLPELEPESTVQSNQPVSDSGILAKPRIIIDDNIN